MAKSKTAAPKVTAKKTATKSKAKSTVKAAVKKSTKSTAKTGAASKSATDNPSKKTVSPQELELMNETGRRKQTVQPKVERRKRRRQIDPTTCEREYSDPEIQFMHAMDEYKRASGRMFPTCSEILEVLTRLGYRQIENPLDSMYEPKTAAKSSDDDWEAEDEL